MGRMDDNNFFLDTDSEKFILTAVPADLEPCPLANSTKKSKSKFECLVVASDLIFGLIHWEIPDI